MAVAHAQLPARTVEKINSNWSFVQGDTTVAPAWKSISLPHTWNAADALDDVPDYYRGVCWYKKIIRVSKKYSGREILLHFEGANQKVAVFVNGKLAGTHAGGYNAFTIPVTDWVRFDRDNEVKVKVDNSFDENIAPLTADFTFYGGIYRDVYLVTTGKVHFNNQLGSNGVFITTPKVSSESAEMKVRATIVNDKKQATSVQLLTILSDATGKKLATKKINVSMPAGTSADVEVDFSKILSPKLWSPDDPYLYNVTCRIIADDIEVGDEVQNKIGFRWFSFDANNGFYLNGKPCKLVGASRHQDYKGLGNAVPDDLAIKDVQLLKNMGANFLRVAHYPQDPSVLEACDSLGLLASVEIPIVNEITESEGFYHNCEQMQYEMIRQHFNHPSVIIWCCMNEILLRPHHNADQEKKQLYYANIRQLAIRLEKISRTEDPYRYTMMANHGNLAQYKNAGLLGIPMLIGWNLYSGWYGGSMDEFPNFLDEFHQQYPQVPFLVTEYGADADARIRSDKPIRFDKSVEYSTRFHQFYLSEMLKRPYVAAAIVWNLADFASETRTETMPHMNNKGLLEFDRTPKDPYYYYQAMLSKRPFIKILGSDKMFGIADSSLPVCYRILQVASNLDSLTLHLEDGQLVTVKVKNGIAQWKLPFKEGVNAIRVTGMSGGKEYSDAKDAVTSLLPHCLKDSLLQFRQMNVVLGASRYYVDSAGNWWQPDKPYEKGEWGYVGGSSYKIKNNNRLPYGTDKNIIGTVDDPIYQTQQTGIRQYKLDVPSGEYEVDLHFAELTGGGKIAVPPYNLTDTSRDEVKHRRIFNVLINGERLLYNFNIAEEYGVVTPVVKKTIVKVNDEEGITIDFEAVEGEPVLNALQVIKR